MRRATEVLVQQAPNARRHRLLVLSFHHSQHWRRREEIKAEVLEDLPVARNGEFYGEGRGVEEHTNLGGCADSTS